MFYYSTYFVKPRPGVFTCKIYSSVCKLHCVLPSVMIDSTVLCDYLRKKCVQCFQPSAAVLLATFEDDAVADSKIISRRESFAKICSLAGLHSRSTQWGPLPRSSNST